MLSHNFPESRFLSAAAGGALGEELARHGIAGGAVYDALVGATAREHDLQLLSSDSRARSTYEALDVRVMLVR